MDHQESLRAETRNAWARELSRSWRGFNDEYLGGRLREPRIVVLDGLERTLGRWDRETRALGISVEHILSASWRSVLATLRHEMAHQATDELEPTATDREGPHGPTFRHYCDRLQAPSSATIEPESRPNAESDPSVRVLRRIEKLLSLAESPNRNEADAAFRKARRLMVEHHMAAHEPGRRNRNFDVVDLGEVRKRHHAWEFVLANILDEFFFVDVIWAHTYDAHACRPGTVLRVYGTRANLDMAEYVHSFSCRIVEELWQDHRARRGITGNRDRLRYLHGLMEGFASTLRTQDVELREERGLVVADDPELREFFHADNPRIRRVTRGGAGSAARAAGERDGRAIRLARPISGAGGFGGLLT